jgi:addiction module HigA family antidote
MSASKTSTAATRADAPIGGADLRRMRREPTHPGKVFLEEFLKPIGYGGQSEAARRMGMSVNRLNEIVGKKRPVTPESAVLMAAVSGTDPRLWLHMQADYDLWHALRNVDTAKIAPMSVDAPASRSRKTA